jgi:hypothetical protein
MKPPALQGGGEASQQDFKFLLGRRLLRLRQSASRWRHAPKPLLRWPGQTFFNGKCPLPEAGPGRVRKQEVRYQVPDGSARHHEPGANSIGSIAEKLNRLSIFLTLFENSPRAYIKNGASDPELDNMCDIRRIC